MGGLITKMFESFTDVIEGITAGIKGAFENILYVDPAAATPELSSFAIFGFVMMGLALALGLVYFVVNLIRRKI